MQLRQCCNSPHNFYYPFDYDDNTPVDETLVTESGKMLLLDRLLPELLDKGHKVLIFSQFKTQLDLLDTYCRELRNWPTSRIDGSVAQTDRQQQILDFNDCNSDVNIFLLSTRAGGQGINLAAADTVYGAHNTQTRMASDTADNLAWERYTNPDSSSPPSVTSAIARIAFSTESSPTPLHRVTELVHTETEKIAASNGRTMIVLVGRSRRLAVESLTGELRTIISETGSHIGSSVSKTLGDVGAALVAKNANASLLVMQASAASASAS